MAVNSNNLDLNYCITYLLVMSRQNYKLDKILVVRITSEQYTKLLETIINEGKKGIKSQLKTIDKSKVIRDLISKYTAHPS